MNLAVFDIDGTLLNNLMVEDQCFASALGVVLRLREFDTDWASYEHVSDIGIAVEAYRREFGRDPSTAELDAASAHFVAQLRTAQRDTGALVPMLGASALLEALTADGWAVALATGAWRRAAEYKLEASGLPVAQYPLATSEDGPARVDIIRHACAQARERAGVGAFARTVSVGDGVWDVRAARTLGLPFVGVARDAQVRRLRTEGADRVVSDFTNLADAFEALVTARIPHQAASRPPASA